MTDRTSRRLGGALVLTAIAVVAVVWLQREAPPLPEDHAQIGPGATFDDAEGAVDYYRAVLRRDPEAVEARVRLAHALMQWGTETGRQAEALPEARTLLDEAVGRAPDHTYGLALQASLMNTLHRFEEARDLSERLLGRHPQFAFVLGTLVDALVELGEYPEAVAASDRLQALKPGLPAYARASYLRELHGDPAGARAAMLLAADAAPAGTAERAWALHHLAGLYLADAKPDTAAYLFEGVLYERPNFAPALAGLGHVALVNGRTSEAVRRLEESRSLMPSEATDELLVEAYTAAGDARKAEAASRRIFDALRDARAMGEIVDMEEADLLADADRDLERALRMAKEQVERRPGHLHANETYAWTLYKTGRAPEAVPFIERAMRLGTGDSMVHYRAARIYEAAGDRSEAARHLRLALNGHLGVESLSAAAEAERLLASLGGGLQVALTSP